MMLSINKSESVKAEKQVQIKNYDAGSLSRRSIGWMDIGPNNHWAEKMLNQQQDGQQALKDLSIIRSRKN